MKPLKGGCCTVQTGQPFVVFHMDTGSASTRARGIYSSEGCPGPDRGKIVALLHVSSFASRSTCPTP